ncbi:MAG: SurA N-terminal domain-containing protein [Acidobacteria bacterium]|nr:SurA N-terminal domain-containing protein [Acidobacteriota bacterium]MCW5949750.1 SurA N-terminal domain-containing protein [Pyrinomonadaceae bacterium]
MNKMFRLGGLAGILLLGFSFISAQETEVRVVDEVVAQVNDSVITLSRIKREKKFVIESYIQDGKTRQEAERLVNEREGELIANLINEELMIQKAKEAGLDQDVDATLNQRFVEIMKQNNVRTLDALYQMMRSQGVEPDDLREMWRKQATRDRLIQREVQSKLYWEASGREVKAYFEANKGKFLKPETVSFSEMFLSFAGRDEKAVREKAKQIYAQLLAGGDFDKIAKESGDTPIISDGKGKLEDLRVSEIVEVVGDPLKGVKVGEFTAPFAVDELGMAILRVDKRELPNGEAQFDENAVRLAILQEKAPEATKKFMARLREDAYIKINDTYRPLVSPILFADERKAKPAGK